MNLKDLRNLDKDDVLGLLGLETKSSTGSYLAVTLGTFSVGLLVGAGLGLMFARKSGRELREDLRGRLKRQADEAEEALNSVRGRAAAAVAPAPATTSKSF
jgi:YtxH-like protein